MSLVKTFWIYSDSRWERYFFQKRQFFLVLGNHHIWNSNLNRKWNYDLSNKAEFTLSIPVTLDPFPPRKFSKSEFKLSGQRSKFGNVLLFSEFFRISKKIYSRSAKRTENFGTVSKIQWKNPETIYIDSWSGTNKIDDRTGNQPPKCTSWWDDCADWPIRRPVANDSQSEGPMCKAHLSRIHPPHSHKQPEIVWPNGQVFPKPQFGAIFSWGWFELPIWL